jgi:uncharacterized protein (TIGR03067 family)
MNNALMLKCGAAVISVAAMGGAYAHYQADRVAAVRAADEQLTQGVASDGSDVPSMPEFPGSRESLPILNADEFRPEITAIDRLVFDPKPIDGDRRTALAAELEKLAAGVRSKSQAPFVATEAGELRQLATYTQNYPETGLRSMLEKQWMRIRNNVFDDRSWFARSAQDLDDAPAAPGSDPFEPLRPENESVNLPARTQPVLAHDLGGRWVVTGLYGNGRPISDPELSNAVWTFSGDELTIESRMQGSSHYTFSQVEDSQGTALRLESQGSNQGPAEAGWMIYEFGERELRVAFYDGLGNRPTGFTASDPNSKPQLNLVTLQRLP